MIKNFFINYIVTIPLLFFVTPSFSQETNLLNKTFLIFLEKEFLSNQIITKKNFFIWLIAKLERIYYN